MRTVVYVDLTSQEMLFEINEWCNLTFGFRGPVKDYSKNPWNVRIGKSVLHREYSFIHEKDAVLFALRWK